MSSMQLYCNTLLLLITDLIFNAVYFSPRANEETSDHALVSLWHRNKDLSA